MRNGTKQILLTAATLCAAGCAKSDYQIAHQSRSNMRDSAMANAPEEKPPKILPETHFAAGMLFERQGQFDKAIPQYRKAVALNHNYVAAYHRLGLLQSAIGQHLEAAQTLQRAVALRPDDAVLHNDLGFEWMRAQQWDEAEGELRRAIELQPDLATAHINLALVQAKSERFAEALASFQAVLPDADAYYNLGLMYRGQQRYGEAVETFRHVLTIDPEFSAAKIQLEQLADRTRAAGFSPREPEPTDDQAPAVAAETPPQAEVVALLDDMAVPGPALLTTTPEGVEEEEYAVEPKHEWGTTLADLAAILAVLDTDAHKDCDPPIDRPAIDDEVVEKPSDEEFVEEISLDIPPTAEVPILFDTPLADAPCEEEMTMPSVVVPTENAVAVFGERDGDETAAAELNEGPSVVAEAMETAEPPAPCDPDFEEVDADDVIVALPAAPTTQQIGFGDSWTVLEELEAKVALLRYEIRTTMIEKGGWNELALMYEASTTPPTWIELDAPILDVDSDPIAEDDGEFDDVGAPFVEIDEEDAAESESPPMPSDAVEEGLRKDPAPSDRTSLWTTQFGDLTELLSIVRNETACWEAVDAEARELLASGDADRPCVEMIEQAVQIESEEYSPAMQSGADESRGVMENELTASGASDRSRDVYATYQRGLERLPD